MRFSVYCLAFHSELNNHKTDTQNKIFMEEIVITGFSFKPGLELTGFRTTQLCFQQFYLTWAHNLIENQQQLKTWACNNVMWYWSADNLIWQVSVDHNIMSYIKKVQGKPRLHASVILLFGGWLPSCATPPSSSSSCICAHEQYC